MARPGLQHLKSLFLLALLGLFASAANATPTAAEVQDLINKHEALLAEHYSVQSNAKLDLAALAMYGGGYESEMAMLALQIFVINERIDALEKLLAGLRTELDKLQGNPLANFFSVYIPPTKPSPPPKGTGDRVVEDLRRRAEAVKAKIHAGQPLVEDLKPKCLALLEETKKVMGE